MCEEGPRRCREEGYEGLGVDGAGFATCGAAAICCVGAGEEGFVLWDCKFPDF